MPKMKKKNAVMSRFELDLLERALSRFRKEEDGVMVIFAVYVFLMMLIVGGIGIDVMRFERDRTMVQYTLDRAVLAAADLDQELAPADVVADYFEKADLSEYLGSVDVDEGLGYRIVSGTAETTMATQFMHMTGVDTLTATAASTAEESIDNVEISLVLDVSGSMNSNSRLTNLKDAAQDFVDEMFDNSEEGKVSISIVPYATQVSVPETLWEYFTVTAEEDDAEIVKREADAGNIPGYPRCINFEEADFADTSVDLDHEYQRTMFFDPWYDFDGRDNDPMETVTLPVCSEDPTREIVVLEDDRDELKDFIEDMWAGGNTSIDVGMKWGVALIDPSLRTAVSGLIDDGEVDADFTGRPFDYDDSETLKVVVLMTDGQNTAQYYINEGFRTGMSNVWWNEEEEVYSVYVGLDVDDEDEDGITDEPLFYWLLEDEEGWYDHAYGEGTYDQTNYEYTCSSYKRNGSCRSYQQIETTVTVDEPGEAVEVSYPDLWAWTTMEEVVEAIYEPWMDDDDAWDDWYYDVRSYVGSSDKNDRVYDMCNTVKDENVIVFTIGFEAPSAGETVLENCASSAAHFFDVDGLEISDAFSAIASSIRQLRLTQ